MDIIYLFYQKRMYILKDKIDFFLFLRLDSYCIIDDDDVVVVLIILNDKCSADKWWIPNNEIIKYVIDNDK